MVQSIAKIEEAMNTLGQGSPWSSDTKVSDVFLDRLFTDFFAKLQMPNLMIKTNYHELARFVPREMIDPEISEVLDLIAETANRAHPGEIAVD